MDTVELDKMIGFWIKDVPYVWDESVKGLGTPLPEFWFTWQRTYILGDVIDGFLIIPCENTGVRNFFKSDSYALMNVLEDYRKKTVRR